MRFVCIRVQLHRELVAKTSFFFVLSEILRNTIITFSSLLYIHSFDDQSNGPVQEGDGQSVGGGRTGKFLGQIRGQRHDDLQEKSRLKDN